jgi:hypothetical protein
MKAFRFIPLIFCLKIRTICCCTNLIVTSAASSDGSLFVAYNADDTELMGLLYHYPAKTTNASDVRKIYSWDDGAFLGVIPEASVTYNVVGNANEYGLVIGETTWYELLDGRQYKGIISYIRVASRPFSCPFFAVQSFTSGSDKGTTRSMGLLKRGPFLIMDL